MAKCGENSNHLGFSQKHRFGQLIYCSHKYDDDYDVQHTLCVKHSKDERLAARVYASIHVVCMFY